MQLWISQVLDPSQLVRHVALFLLVVATAMPSIGLVRWLGLGAGIVGAFFSGAIIYDGSALFWWGLLILVAGFRLILASNWRAGHRLTAEEEVFHQRAVPDLNAGEVRRLLSVGTWREVVPGTQLTRSNEHIAELCFILRGQVDIVVDRKKIGEVGPGSFVGEIGLSTGDPATADAICATPVRYLGFDANRLYRLLDAHPALQDAMELAIERSLREKLHRSNIAAARGEVRR